MNDTEFIEQMTLVKNEWSGGPIVTNAQLKMLTAISDLLNRCLDKYIEGKLDYEEMHEVFYLSVMTSCVIGSASTDLGGTAIAELVNKLDLGLSDS